MGLPKQAINIPFNQGLDLKSDPRQIAPGKFLALQNSIFTKEGLLQKRNGYKQLANLPLSANFATTFNGNLTAIGNTLQAYSQGTNTWVNKGNLRQAQLETLPLIRSSTNQSQSDSAVSSNGLVCTVFTDNITSGTITNPSYKYVIADSTTGQNISAPTVIPVSSGTVTGSPRIFVLGKYFVIVFTNIITATPHLQYIAIALTNPTVIASQANITSQYTNSSTVNWDGVVANNNLYLAWNGSDGGGAIRMISLSSTLALSAPVIFAGHVATIMSVTFDATTPSPVIWASFYDSASSTGYVLAVNQILGTVLAPTQIITTGSFLNITSTSQNMILSVFYEADNAYSYDSSIKTHFINKKTVTQAGVVSSANVVARSVGLASKAFLISSQEYMLVVYSSAFQPTYFLIDSSGNVISKLAYSNAAGYFVLGLPGVTVTNNIIQVSYLVKDLIEAVNKEQGLANPAGIYSQTGVNLVSFTLNEVPISTAEIGNELNLSGGILWGYDGYSITEQGFHLWPDNVEVTTSGAGGLITAQQYFYQAIYEWTDNQGNVFRSAPSIPVSITTTGATSSNTINIPTLRLTYKTANPLKIVIYRWSTAQQNYYQVTSLAVPVLNNTTIDSIAFVDKLADSTILGNELIYTTGGVIENIGAPACTVMTLYKSRLILVDAEDRNLLWYSKQVIESTPVEMSDLFTIYVAPTAAAQGATGPITALSALDDKLIIFKRDAIYYITGNGPDNTGAQNDFSEPIFITSTVGCANQNSIVMTPQGLMFQSDKGIWLLDRNLSTTYIGSPVEDFNEFTVFSSKTIPGTNFVLFTMSNGTTLMYDYFYGQWGEFINIPAVSSTLYQDLHTYINRFGQVFQENPGSYLDGAKPVLMSFITGWFNLAGIQGFQRAHYFYLLGEFISPHKISAQIAYDYNPTAVQQTIITPDNYDGFYGDYSVYGGSDTYSKSPVEPWRVFLEKQKCQAFQIQFNEIYDASHGGIPGAGLTLSGINLVFGLKKQYVPIAAANSAG